MQAAQLRKAIFMPAKIHFSGHKFNELLYLDEAARGLFFHGEIPLENFCLIRWRRMADPR
jgi:hypothetical protein